MVTEKAKIKRFVRPDITSGGLKKNASPALHGVGRRKSAVARVWASRGTGELVVNGKKHVEYFDTDINRQKAFLTMSLIPMAADYNFEVNVYGGGLCAQADAIKLGIARALVVIDESNRPTLRQLGLLTCDSRRKERKKYGQKAARRKFQFVKR